MSAFPDMPRNDALLGVWLMRKHSDVFQQVTIGIVEEHGCGRHPREDHGVFGPPPVEVERRDSGRLQDAGRQ